MSISSKSTGSETSRITFGHIPGYYGPDKLTHEINLDKSTHCQLGTHTHLLNHIMQNHIICTCCYHNVIIPGQHINLKVPLYIQIFGQHSSDTFILFVFKPTFSKITLSIPLFLLRKFVSEIFLKIIMLTANVLTIFILFSVSGRQSVKLHFRG